MKFKWRITLLAVVAIACVNIAFSHALATAPQLTLRIAAAFVVLSVSLFAIYTVCRTRRFRLSTLLLVFPVIAALVTTLATPYVRHQMLVEQLKHAGIDEYQLEPTQFEATLGYFAETILGHGFYSFSTDLIYAEINLETCKTENLRKLAAGVIPRRVSVGNRYDGTIYFKSGEFTPSLIFWLNSLPERTAISILGYQLDDDDVRSLSRLKHRASYHIGDPQSHSAIDFVYEVDAEQLVIWNIALPSGYKRPENIGRARSLSINQDSKVETGLIIDLIESKQIEDVVSGKCNFSIEECSRLAAVPGLSQVSIEGLGFDELMALSASKSLKTAHFLDPILTDSEEEQVRSAYSSVVGSLFFTKPKRRIVPLQ